MSSNDDKIIKMLEKHNSRYPIYEIRRPEYNKVDSKIPFRITTQPLKISRELKEEIMGLGLILYMYFNAIIKLYNTDENVKRILDNGKQQRFIGNSPNYLFIRPDLIITNQGLKICELETSILGLGLADILNKSYIDLGYDTLVPRTDLKDYIHSVIPKQGVIAYSQRVKAFKGQIEYLANHVFSTHAFDWQGRMIGNKLPETENVYRAFYTSDCITEPAVNELLDSNVNFIPSLTPQFDEKALLSFIWDKRYSDFFQKELGKSVYDYLKKVIPPTFIVGQEHFFELGLPGNVGCLEDIKNLPKGKRKVVLKKSLDSSWGEDIKFLHQISRDRVSFFLKNAINSKELFIIQEFFEGKKCPMDYIMGKDFCTMQAKVRLTPYYAVSGQNIGKLIAIKATGCEKTDYIHGATNSINTAVRV